MNPRTTDANGEARFTITSSTPGSSTLAAEGNGATISRGVIQDGAVGIWSFEADGRDGSGLNNHGTLQNAPAFVAGGSGHAIALNGLSQYVEVAPIHPSTVCADGRAAVASTLWSANQKVFAPR